MLKCTVCENKRLGDTQFDLGTRQKNFNIRGTSQEYFSHAQGGLSTQHIWMKLGRFEPNEMPVLELIGQMGLHSVTV
jgi:hypothetical protein